MYLIVILVPSSQYDRAHEHNHSSSASGKKADLVVISYDLHPPHTAFVATVSVPLLPSHVPTSPAPPRTPPSSSRRGWYMVILNN
jgi:hypothetical protein